VGAPRVGVGARRRAAHDARLPQPGRSAGPGRISIDRLLGIRLPRWTLVPGAAIVAASTWFALVQSERATRSETGIGDGTPELVTPERVEVVGEAGAAESDAPAGPDAPLERRVEEPLGGDAVATASPAGSS
jgi:hypothetical protein